jgi:nucleotide-binding universal stress UspA family protein
VLNTKFDIMRNIIVPMDFSTESMSGLEMAILFSKHKQITVHLINVEPLSAENEKNKTEYEYEVAENNFKRILSTYGPKLGNNSAINYTIKKGRVYQEVVALAEQIPDSLITASTHGASGFQEFFIGSNAYRIISSTNLPVITLRKNFCPSEIKRIVLPIDLTVDTRQKVPFTTDMAKLFGAEIHVVGLQTSRSKRDIQKVRSYASQVAGYIEGSLHCVSNEVYGVNVDDLVLNYAQTIRADLISITTERSSGLSLILGNTAHQILNRAEIPVLCLTPKSLRKSGTFVTTGG